MTFNLNEAYTATSKDPDVNESNDQAVDWSVLRIYVDYLLEQGLPAQADGIEHLINHQLRPRSGTLYTSKGKKISYWWYYHTPLDDSDLTIRALNVIPVDVAQHLTGKVRKEGSNAAIIVYRTFSDAIQDFGRAWEKWTIEERVDQ